MSKNAAGFIHHQSIRGVDIHSSYVNNPCLDEEIEQKIDSKRADILRLNIELAQTRNNGGECSTKEQRSILEKQHSILDQMSRILCEVDVLAMAQAVFPKVPVQNEQLSKRIQAIATFVFSHL